MLLAFHSLACKKNNNKKQTNKLKQQQKTHYNVSKETISVANYDRCQVAVPFTSSKTPNWDDIAFPILVQNHSSGAVSYTHLTLPTSDGV